MTPVIQAPRSDISAAIRFFLTEFLVARIWQVCTCYLRAFISQIPVYLHDAFFSLAARVLSLKVPSAQQSQAIQCPAWKQSVCGNGVPGRGRTRLGEFTEGWADGGKCTLEGQ